MDFVKFLRSFRTKITLSILGVGLIAVLLGLSVTYFVGRTHLQNTIGVLYREMASQTGQRLEGLIKSNIETITLLGLASDIRSGVETANTAYTKRRMTETDIRKRIKNLETLWGTSSGRDSFIMGFLENQASDFLKGYLRNPEERSEHLSIIITDQRGILVGADVKPRHIYYGDETWWKATFNNGMGSTYISDIEIAQEGTEEFENLYTLSIAVPIMDPTGQRAIGAIKSDLQIKRFFETVTGVHAGKADHTMLASSDGTLIFCPIFLIRNHTIAQDLMQVIMVDEPGWAITKADVHFTGINSISGFSPVNFGGNIHADSLGGKQWYIFTSQNPVFTYAPINTLLNWILISVFLGFLLLSILGLRVADYIVRPLRELQKGAKLIGYGNLDNRLKIKTGDEIQELADEFNEMAIKLQSSYASLEQRVSERTQELAVINKITRIISSSLDVSQIFESFSSEVHKLMRYDRISISLMDNSLKHIQFRLIKTKNTPTQKHETPRSKSGTAIGWVVDHQQPFIRNNASETVEFLEDRLVLKDGFRSYIIMPIISQLKTIGTLNLVSQEPQAFTDRNLEILVPITEQIAIAIETIRLFEETKKLDQLKSEFVSKVSHELRTPLTSIKGFAEILLSYQDVDHKTQKDFLTIIHDESDRLTRLINNILDLSKIESGRPDWNIRPVSPSKIITHTVKSIRAIAMEKNLPITVEARNNLPMVQGDQDMLVQVLDNLLGNAIKFTSTGRITVKASEEYPNVRFSVIDTGIGIKDTDVEKIFDKFFQLGDTRTGKPQGTGLGLAICREIVHYLRGKIWCESTPRKGSAFHFTVPIWEKSPVERSDSHRSDRPKEEGP